MFFRMFKILLFCLIFVSFTCVGSFAAEKASVKIGIMNVQKVLIESEPGKEAKKRFEVKKSELEKGFIKEQEALKELQQEIEKKGSVWSKEKKEEKVLEFNKMRRDLQTKTEDARMEMKHLQDKELEPIIKALEKVVDTYGEKNGFTAILDSKNGVIYFDKSTDISDALIAELNKAMK